MSGRESISVSSSARGALFFLASNCSLMLGLLLGVVVAEAFDCPPPIGEPQEEQNLGLDPE